MTAPTHTHNTPAPTIPLEQGRHYNNETRYNMLMRVIERDGPYCSGEGCRVHLSTIKPIDVHLHHVTALKDGGSDAIENLKALCRVCHTHATLHEIRTRQRLYVCGQEDGQENTSAYTLTDEQEQPEEKSEMETIRIDRPMSSGFIVRKKQSASDVQDEKTKTATMRKNDRCEKPFNAWLDEMLVGGYRYSIEEWCNGGANQFECSQESVWRYLKKRLDLPDCNPINGDLTLAPYQGKQVVVHKKKQV